LFFEGNCVDGKCICDQGFSGEDCSMVRAAPSIFFAPFCDVSTEECSSATVFGDGFSSEDGLTCTYQPAEVSL